jgi:hypothetical protein
MSSFFHRRVRKSSKPLIRYYTWLSALKDYIGSLLGRSCSASVLA